jgi:uncharacterized MAPEG superfamily protein
MTIANWCIAAASLLPMGVALIPKVSSMLGQDRYDNNHPRDWAQRQAGWAKRAFAAHSNGFETLPLFVAGVIVAQNAHMDQGRVDALALAYIAIRIIYSALYIANLGVLRTAVWFAGIGVSLALLLMA